MATSTTKAVTRKARSNGKVKDQVYYKVTENNQILEPEVMSNSDYLISEQLIERMTDIMVDFGLDLDDPNLAGSPRRVLKAWSELLEGARNTNDRAAQILGVVFPGDYDEVVVVRNIRTNGLCPHHFFPIMYNVTVGYLPNVNGMVVGLSKIPRMIELLAHRPVVQEQLTTDIVGVLMNHLHPRGAGVVVTGAHGCMTCRGVEQRDADMVTAKMEGVFRTDPSVRQEFMDHARPPAHALR